MQTDSDSDWQTRINNAPRPFNLVSQNLQELGSVSINRYLSALDSDLPPTNYAQPTTETSTTSPTTKPPDLLTATPSVKEPDSASTSVASVVKMQDIVRLHQECQRTFGGGQALKYHFVEENGPKSKQCILTITRPNGLVRSYQTEPTFSRKNDAKAQAAKIALEMGALEFIQTGDSDPLKTKKGLLLSPFDNTESFLRERASQSPVEPSEDDKVINKIESSCTRWRAGEVTPQWFFYRDPKTSGHGAALRIMLSTHAFRIYSSATTYSCPSEAKAACAKSAIDEGVLDYIKRGNGHNPSFAPVGDEYMSTRNAPAVTGPVSLQDFYDSLPKPFPEFVGEKTASEINGPAWLNTTIQTARGGRLKAAFFWLIDGSAGFHGCLLRLERPGECRSFLIDPRFQKRGDAKAAVCLLAMSQGIGNYIREIGAATQTKPSHQLKAVAHQYIYPQLASECEKIRTGNRPIYTSDTDRDAFGCTLTVDISPSAEQPDIHEYKVEPEYRTKADAKAAVACLAAKEGLFELLRFRGQPPPPGYKPFWELHNETSVTGPLKRKELIDQDGAPSGSRNKKQKSNPPEGLDVNNNGNPKPGRKGSWKKPPASGSSGLVSLGSSAHTRGSKDSNLSGHRSVGSFMPSYGGPHFHGMAGPSVPFNPLYPPLPPNGWPSYEHGSYHLPAHPVANPFQQQNPFSPTSVGGLVCHAPHHGPPSSSYFQGNGMMPPPIPYASYPQYSVHHPPIPGPSSYGYALPAHEAAHSAQLSPEGTSSSQ